MNEGYLYYYIDTSATYLQSIRLYNIMTSRKKNKGRERKAKKAELEADKAKLQAEKEERQREIVRKSWTGWARGDINGQPVVECNHRVDSVLPNDKNHSVTNFIDALFLFEASDSSNLHLGFHLRDTFTKHRELWGNERYRKMAVNILIKIGTNFLLRNEHGGSFLVAHAIVALENYDGEGILNTCVALTKLRDILGRHSLRDVLKFFRKRTACSCLKRMHLEERKTQPKTGFCDHCHEDKERALLMVCSRCRLSQYCSRECQIAHWPKHRSDCDIYCSTQRHSENVEIEL